MPTRQPRSGEQNRASRTGRVGSLTNGSLTNGSGPALGRWTNPTKMDLLIRATSSTMRQLLWRDLATTTRPPNESDPTSTLRSGSAGDLEDPIGTLEDGSVFDPAWSAAVVLSCGTGPDTRIIEAFEANANSRGDAHLYRGEHAGAGRVFTVEVDEEIPHPAKFLWAIDGILVGPWPIDEITDIC